MKLLNQIQVQLIRPVRLAGLTSMVSLILSGSIMNVVRVILVWFSFTSYCALAAHPSREYRLFPEKTVTAPDKSFRIKQYANKDWNWQIWIFPSSGTGEYPLTKAGDFSGYAGYFEISPDSNWVLRIQKIYSGTITAYLYHRDSKGSFAPHGNAILENQAWDFLTTQPDIQPEQIPAFHKEIDFVEWRDNQYLILALSGIHFLKLNDKGDLTRWIINDWRCAYDLNKKRFIMLPDLIQRNKGKIYKIKNENG
jgi:hypothetical protein